MTKFLFGLAIGLGASAIAFVGIVAAYNPPLVDVFPAFANALGYYIVGTVIVALAALIVAMVRVGMFDVMFPRRRRPAAPSSRSEAARRYR